MLLEAIKKIFTDFASRFVPSSVLDLINILRKKHDIYKWYVFIRVFYCKSHIFSIHVHDFLGCFVHYTIFSFCQSITPGSWHSIMYFSS